jgi:hypothetical protein
MDCGSITDVMPPVAAVLVTRAAASTGINFGEPFNAALNARRQRGWQKSPTCDHEGTLYW